MALYAYRSQKVEQLVDALAKQLRGSWPDDPFEPLAIVVGSRGMERWLRHELATRHGSIARVDFLFPRTAFEGLARWLVEGPHDAPPRFAPRPASEEPWSGGLLALRVLRAIRARIEAPAFAAVRGFLGAPTVDVRPRELAFAQEVATVVERLLHDRPEDALRFTDAPASAPADERWLAELLAELHRHAEPSPARRLHTLRALAPRAEGRRHVLRLFGLSTLRPGDKRRIAELARHLDVHLFALAPSSEWWGEIRSRREQGRELLAATDERRVAELLHEYEKENVLLSSYGAPSRDKQIWLEELRYEDGEVPAASPSSARADTLLARVQAYVEAAETNPSAKAAPWPEHAGCDSLEVHACHGALRQCEALRDELLRRFARDPSLEPRHVLVMTPDIGTYAPLLAAVFARGVTSVAAGTQGAGAAPAIPLQIADLGLRAINDVAEALLQALALADERVTAPALLSLLSLRPVRARFGLDDDDLADLRAMLVGSGVRWAWDADDRARHDQPALDQHTVRFGLERLALGVLMPAPEGLGVVPAQAGQDVLGAAVPIDVATRDRVARFGHLAALCETLQRLRERVLEPATAPRWRQRLREHLDALTVAEGRSAWLRVQVDRALDACLPDSPGEPLLLHRTAVTALLRGAFELTQHGDRPLSGAVTVCALEPMRSVPFRIIAMVGLDDRAFPRGGRTPAWDPFARPRFGEHDRRAVDRHLFLEALLCARDALLVFGTGFEPTRGAPTPLSVVASELLELCAAGVGRAPQALLRAHPLQPWSPKAFDAEGRRPFDGLWAEGARALRMTARQAGLPASSLEAPWPEEEAAPPTLTAEALAGDLARPQKALLLGRLGLPLDPEDTDVPEREPIEHDELESWAIRARILDAMAANAEVDVERLETRLRAEGALPLRAGGREALEKRIREAKRARESAEAIGERRLGARTYACALDDASLSAACPDVRESGDRHALVFLTASKTPNPRLQLQGWLTLLIARAGGEPVGTVHLVGCASAFTLRAPESAAEAKGHLCELVACARALRTGPRLLFPQLSRAVAEAALKHPERPQPPFAKDAITAWEGTPQLRGDVADPYVAALFGHLDLEDLEARAGELLALAERVWGPLLRAEGKAAADAATEENMREDTPAKKDVAKKSAATRSTAAPSTSKGKKR